MIRLIQRRLIIPRGDTGSFSIPVLSKGGTDNIAVFTIFDETTRTKMFQKIISGEGDVLTIAFTHSDTVNLKPGKYVWDIKYYKNPEYIDDELVNGEEIDSYYAGFSLPVCEIRETADNYLVSPEAPTATLSPEQLEIVTGAIHSLNEAIRKTQENVEHYPEIRDEVWYVWDAELGDYVSTGVSANGIVGNGIASAVLNNDYTLTLNFTDGTSFTSPSIRGQKGNGIDDIVLNNNFTLTISYTDGGSYTTPSIRGPIGPTPQFSIGTVQDGAVAAASVTGTAENPVLNLTLPNANVPTALSQLLNDVGYLTQHQDLSDYVQKTDYATLFEPGVIQVAQMGEGISSTYNGVALNTNHVLRVYPATESGIKSPFNKDYAPIVPKTQHISAFYGLAKAAGDTTQSQSSNAVGTYTNEAKAAIQTMLDVPSTSDIPTQVSELTNDAGYLTTETDPTVPAWAKAAQKPTYTASEVGAPTVAEMNTAIGTAIGNINSFDMAIVQALPTQDISTHTIYLVPKTGETNDVYDEYVYINNNWEMIGNTQINLSNYVQKTDYATSSNAGVVKISSAMGIDITNGFLTMSTADHGYIQDGTHTRKAIPPKFQHESVFYGLSKVAGVDLANETVTLGTYPETSKTAIRSMLGAVGDVQLDGTSVVTNGVANIPYADANITGVVKVRPDWGVGIYNGTLLINGASASDVKSGNNSTKAVSAYRQHESTFYGLAKAAGHDEKNSTESVGTYTPEAKGAIQSMLGVSDLIATAENNLVASKAYAIGDVFTANGKLYKATAAIAADAAIIPAAEGEEIVGANCVETKVGEGFVKFTDYATSTTPGVVKIDGLGLLMFQGQQLIIVKATDSEIKTGIHNYDPIVPSQQHKSTFYGLAKAAGADEKDSILSIGQYTDSAKAAIQHMLGTDTTLADYESDTTADQAYAIGELFMLNGKLHQATAAIAINDTLTVGTNCAIVNAASVFPHDVQVNGVSVMQNGVANVPEATNLVYGAVKLGPGFGHASNGTLTISSASSSQIKAGTNSSNVIKPEHQHESTFYGLAKAAGDTTQAESDNAIGTYTNDAKSAIRTMLGAVGDVQVNGTSVVTNGVANVPTSGINQYGVAKIGYSSESGLEIASNGNLRIFHASANNIKSAISSVQPITPDIQHASTFYGLAKASGDTTQSASSNAVGVYTDNAKASIKAMLGIQDGSTGTVDVSGATPTITAVENTRYVCGEVTSLSFTPAASGICIVRFTSGSTVTVLTLPNTVKFPEWFDPTSLETNTIYEICVTDGVYGAVMSWAL